jgi:hypothetical protein
MSDALLSRILRTHGLWSASRGLAQHQNEYNTFLAACDAGRRGDLDGRGNLSESSLAEFTKFFLATCLEQVRFMRMRMRLDEIGAHVDGWGEASAMFGHAGAADVRRQPLHPSASNIVKALLHGGTLSVGECRGLLPRKRI